MNRTNLKLNSAAENDLRCVFVRLGVENVLV